MRVVDRKTNQPKSDTGMMEVTQLARTGSPVIPVALKLGVDKLDPGQYQAELSIADNTGTASSATIASSQKRWQLAAESRLKRTAATAANTSSAVPLTAESTSSRLGALKT